MGSCGLTFCNSCIFLFVIGFAFITELWIPKSGRLSAVVAVKVLPAAKEDKLSARI